jgi:hypothetical protein
MQKGDIVITNLMTFDLLILVNEDPDNEQTFSGTILDGRLKSYLYEAELAYQPGDTSDSFEQSAVTIIYKNIDYDPD